MAAIKRRTRHLMVMLPAMAIMLLGYQNCAMDMAPTTPGASSLSCAPTSQQLADFEVVLNDVLNKSGNFASGNQSCSSCHGDSVSPNGEGGYIVFQGSTTTNPGLVLRNYCAALNVGQQVADHPMSVSHGGGAYPASDIQSLLDFALANF